MVGVMLYSIPSSLRRFCSEVLWEAGGVSYRSVCTLAWRLGGRQRNWMTVSRFHPSPVF